MDSTEVDGLNFVKELRTYGMGQRIWIVGLVSLGNKTEELVLAASGDAVLSLKASGQETCAVVSELLDKGRRTLD